MTDRSDVIGIDLGGTKITAALVDTTGQVSFAVTVATPATEGPESIVECVARIVGRVTESADRAGRRIGRVGVGAAGVIDTRSGSVLSATDQIPGWAGFDLRGRLEAATGLPAAVLNDVHAHGLGEAWIGAGRDRPTVLMVTVGTGVGGALLTRGEVIAGAHALAGHIGHVPSPEALGLVCTCGGVGHVEAVASGPSLHAAYLRLGGDPTHTDARAVMAAAEQAARPGDAIARQAVTLAATALGRALGGMINSFDPDVLIVGGGVAVPDTLWWHQMVEAASGETLLPLTNYEVTPPRLGRFAAVIGAARLAFADRRR